MDDLIARIVAAAADFERLRGEVTAREPWPLSAAYGTEPESDWGPKEVLAHVAEMLPYWTAQIRTVAAGGEAPVPFGRVASDPQRIGRIGRDRRLPAGELFDRVAGGAAGVAAVLGEIGPSGAARRGAHARLGAMTIEEIGGRFIVGHLEEHARQLGEILAARTTA